MKQRWWWSEQERVTAQAAKMSDLKMYPHSVWFAEGHHCVDSVHLGCVLFYHLELPWLLLCRSGHLHTCNMCSDLHCDSLTASCALVMTRLCKSNNEWFETCRLAEANRLQWRYLDEWVDWSPVSVVLASALLYTLLGDADSMILFLLLLRLPLILFFSVHFSEHLYCDSFS